jgi:hypothetical protein
LTLALIRPLRGRINREESFTSITRIATAHGCAYENGFHERLAIRVHRVALLLAHHVAIARLLAFDERKTFDIGQTRFKLRFALLRQTQVTRFGWFGTGTRRRAQRSGTTRRNREFRKSRRVRHVTPTNTIGHIRGTRFNALNEARARGLACAIAIGKLTLIEQAVATLVA